MLSVPLICTQCYNVSHPSFYLMHTPHFGVTQEDIPNEKPWFRKTMCWPHAARWGIRNKTGTSHHFLSTRFVPVILCKSSIQSSEKSLIQFLLLLERLPTKLSSRKQPFYYECGFYGSGFQKGHKREGSFLFHDVWDLCWKMQRLSGSPAPGVIWRHHKSYVCSCYCLSTGMGAPVYGLSLWPGLPHSMVVSE